MIFNEFILEYLGQPCEVVDPTAKDQCFDLVVAYCDQVLGIPRSANGNSIFPFGNAYQIFTLYGPEQAKYFERIYNGPTNKPKAGDIVVWEYQYNNGGGHTGIATGSGVAEGKNTDWFSCFVQNDPVGEKCQVIENYSFNNVLGWLRPISLINTPNANQYINASKQSAESLRNNVNTALQIGDPDIKTKLYPIEIIVDDVKSLLQQAK